MDCDWDLPQTQLLRDKKRNKTTLIYNHWNLFNTHDDVQVIQNQKLKVIDLLC